VGYDAAGLLSASRAEARAQAEGAGAGRVPAALLRARAALALVRAGADAALRAPERSPPPPPLRFSQRTEELLGSLAALSAGLQEVESRRRRSNEQLRRSPADLEHLRWHKSAPPGYSSPYAV